MAACSTTPQSPELDQDQENQEQTSHAPRYRVLLHNDELTPMEFVVEILRSVFRKPKVQAVQIMLTAHHRSIALVAVLPLEQAEFRVDQAHSLARCRKYPLRLTYEQDE